MIAPINRATILNKYITQILHDYFTDEVKDMTDKEFKDHLIGLNWEIDE